MKLIYLLPALILFSCSKSTDFILPLTPPPVTVEVDTPFISYDAGGIHYEFKGLVAPNDNFGNGVWAYKEYHQDYISEESQRTIYEFNGMTNGREDFTIVLRIDTLQTGVTYRGFDANRLTVLYLQIWVGHDIYESFSATMNVTRYENERVDATFEGGLETGDAFNRKSLTLTNGIIHNAKIIYQVK